MHNHNTVDILIDISYVYESIGRRGAHFSNVCNKDAFHNDYSVNFYTEINSDIYHVMHFTSLYSVSSW